MCVCSWVGEDKAFNHPGPTEDNLAADLESMLLQAQKALPCGILGFGSQRLSAQLRKLTHLRAGEVPVSMPALAEGFSLLTLLGFCNRGCA